ncbi:phospholipase D family protein [Halalkalibacillus halophilus]|uniref:phospholipase D family protein n=1 Tax=Halalkalibacillus halophilus TaxID=392827 RepID=UPI0004250378|nr:phospholipase D family protein [Halalkalibacillus halophilus]
MINVTEDRLNYSELLHPPEGYRVEFAVANTYSLDLETLIGFPIALNMSAEMNKTVLNDPLSIIEGIRQSSERLAVFCQGGQMLNSGRENRSIFGLLEDNVFEVNLEDQQKSFHPKIWLIKFVNEANESRYRLIVLSRNMTFDRSWDMAVALEGKRTEQNAGPDTEPLINLLTFLKSSISSHPKSQAIQSIIEELPYIEFDAEDKHIKDMNFLPLGIETNQSEVGELFSYYHQMLIVSPFLSKSMLEKLMKLKLTDENMKNILITRRTELSELPSNAFDHFDVYVIKETIIDGEEMISEGLELPDLQEIHAKLYVKRKYNIFNFYVGSANCSNNAFHGNVEFLLNFQYKRWGFKFDELIEELLGEDHKFQPFEKVEEIPVQEEVETPIKDRLADEVRRLSNLHSQATVTATENQYELLIEFDDFVPHFDMTISPLLSKASAQLKEKVTFHQLDLLELGEFYLVRVESGGERVERIIKIDTFGIPPNRNQKIYQHLIKDSNYFLQYISYLLADDFLLTSLEDKHLSGLENDFQSKQDYIPVIYEKMLRTAYYSPEKLADIEEIMNLIERESVVPETFLNVYSTFQQVIEDVTK